MYVAILKGEYISIIVLGLHFYGLVVAITSPDILGMEFFVGPDWSRPTFNHIHDVTPSNPFACQAMRFFSTDHNLLPFHRHRASTPITATSRLHA